MKQEKLDRAHLDELVSEAIVAIQFIAGVQQKGKHEDLHEACNSIRPVQDLIREFLQGILRVQTLSEKISLARGQRKARIINEHLSSFGLRFKFAEKQEAATLACSPLGKTRHDGTRTPIFVLQSTNRNKRTTRSLGNDLSAIELIPLRHQRRRHRNRR
ncbi:MAG: hypothetical protein AAB853_01580 [Patescibacteria group bacterium]